MSAQYHTDVLIIGAGAAGYTAAIYAARADRKPIIVQGIQPGGQMTITTDVENYPGFADPIQGPWLMEEMRRQAEHVGTEIIEDVITSVDLSSRPYVAIGDSGARYTGEALVIATGAQARWLGLPSEKKFTGFGVSACATCDGFFFRGKEVAVIGGGNTAVEEALFLARFASKVTLVHRRDALRAEKIMQGRLFADPKVNVVWNSVVEEVLGDDGPVKGVTGLRIRHVASGETTTLPVDGVFVAIGHDPATSLFEGQLDLDDSGYIRIAPWSTATSREAVWAAGDVADPHFRQAVTAAAMGAMAALEAEKWLAAHPAREAAASNELRHPEPVDA
jgi:thioredoxin reductase (NADPH)